MGSPDPTGALPFRLLTDQIRYHSGREGAASQAAFSGWFASMNQALPLPTTEDVGEAVSVEPFGGTDSNHPLILADAHRHRRNLHRLMASFGVGLREDDSYTASIAQPSQNFLGVCAAVLRCCGASSRCLTSRKSNRFSRSRRWQPQYRRSPSPKRHLGRSGFTHHVGPYRRNCPRAGTS